MKLLLKVLFEKIKTLFNIKKVQFKSTEENHWINHICDETITWPNSALMWTNNHGFDEGPGQTYWFGIDVRSFGIRCADHVLKFKSKSLYDEYKEYALRNPTKVLYKMREDSRLNYKYGDDVNIEFIFRWGDDDKTFDVHLSTDSFAEEK